MRCLLLLCAFGAAGRAADPPPAPAPRPAETDAWDRLPPRAKPPLPEWARALAGPLPKTTAHMLEQDHLHRAANPLGPRLAAEVRYEVADALDSPYGRAAAKADWERVGGTAITPETRAFVRKLTLAGHAITDAEFAAILKAFGPKDTTALVHTVAYANFQNRIWLGLGIGGESPPAPPLAQRFDFAAAPPAPERPSWDVLKGAKGAGLAVKVEWSAKDLDRLGELLEGQKAREGRVPMPPAAELEKLPPRERDSAKRVVWTGVSAGYQPELTRAWLNGLYAYYDEAKVDRVFTNAAFWVVTRTNDCFY